MQMEGLGRATVPLAYTSLSSNAGWCAVSPDETWHEGSGMIWRLWFG